MSRNILFISEQLVKDRSTANDNIDPKLILPCIKYCQDVYLEAVLGTVFFRHLQDQIDGGTLTAEEKDLIDNYVIDTLLYYVLSELPMTLGYKFFNKNVLKKDSENSQSAALYELQSLMAWYKDKAEYYEKRMVAYLKAVSTTTLFPQYIEWSTRCDNIPPKTLSYSTPFYLGDGYMDASVRKSFEDRFQGQNDILGDLDTLDGGTV